MSDSDPGRYDAEYPQLLHTNPELAKSIKANDLGKYARKLDTKTKAKVLRRKPAENDPDVMPWDGRLVPRANKRKANLAVLSDED